MIASDIPAIAAIEREAFGAHAWSQNLFIGELEDASKHYYVFDKDGMIAGYGGFAHILDEAHIMNIAVERTCRGHGIGKALLQELIGRAKDAGARAMTLEVRAQNFPAISLYEKAGFVYAGSRKDYYAKGEDALIYWLTL
jgi:ribosomal-protein-alanine N-acetyltransferase